MDKQELAQKIKNLEGLTNEEKADLLQLLNQNKKYGLIWEEKTEDVEERLRDYLPVLHEVKDRFIPSDAPDAPNHIIIEGDNLEALTTLSYTHEGKIDVIYIDPPYNTGNKDFVYNDRFVDSEDSYRHSKWLSFMNKRLIIAKRLLSDRGVIFISIDDNEQAQLKLLCDEVFGKDNFCGLFIWHKKSGGGQTDMYFVTEHEYVSVYKKSSLFCWIDPSEKMSEDNFSFKDTKGFYNLTKLEKWGSAAHKEDRPSMYFPIKNADNKDYYPIAPDGKPGRWRVGMDRMKSLIENNNIEWKKGIPYEKVYYDKNNEKIRTYKSRSILYQIGETGDGTKLLTDIFGSKDIFDNPKPLSLIKELLSHNITSTILDFFAGSGTTLHATMQLNSEDGGHRQCILVTNNENNICEEVTYERNKRVINGYTTPKGVKVEGLHNNRLRYYRTAYLPREYYHRNKQDLMLASTDLLCIKENIYDEQPILIDNRKINSKFAKCFGGADKRIMLIVYVPEVIKYIVEFVKEQPSDINVKIFVFSDGRYAFNDDFKEVINRIDLCALPDAIYQAYKRVLPPKREKTVYEEIDEDNLMVNNPNEEEQ